MGNHTFREKNRGNKEKSPPIKIQNLIEWASLYNFLIGPIPIVVIKN